MTAREEAEDKQLQAARRTFPDWDITSIFGGWLAVPKGTVVVKASSIDSLVAKLRQRDG